MREPGGGAGEVCAAARAGRGQEDPLRQTGHVSYLYLGTLNLMAPLAVTSYRPL